MDNVPDPSTDPLATLTLLEKLYHSGAFFCLGIIVVFLALRYASTHVKWLEEDHRAVYVAALLGGLGLLVVPALQGATPNVQQIATAIGTVIALALNPKKATTAVALLAMLMLMPTASGCSGAVKKDAAAAEAAFSTCAKADLGQQVGSSATSVLAAVFQIVVAGAADWEAELDKLVLQVGNDTVQCALDAIEAVISPPKTSAGSGPGSTKVGAGAPGDAILRIRSYRAKLTFAATRPR